MPPLRGLGSAPPLLPPAVAAMLRNSRDGSVYPARELPRLAVPFSRAAGRETGRPQGGAQSGGGGARGQGGHGGVNCQEGRGRKSQRAALKGLGGAAGRGKPGVGPEIKLKAGESARKWLQTSADVTSAPACTESERTGRGGSREVPARSAAASTGGRMEMPCRAGTTCPSSAPATSGARRRRARILPQG